MTALQIGNGLRARLDAIQKVADMQRALLFRIARSVLERFAPGLSRREWNRLRAADRMTITADARHDICGIVFLIRIDFEAGAAQGHAAFRVVELKASGIRVRERRRAIA